jgi:hypothetical protein
MSSNKRRNEKKNKEIFDNFFASYEELRSENLFIFRVPLVPHNGIFILLRIFLSMDDKWEKNSSIYSYLLETSVIILDVIFL